MSSAYERELKGILSGDQEVIAGSLKTLPEDDRDAYVSAARAPFLVVRAAGSLGADLVALRHDLSFIVEVKSSKQDRIHFSDSARLVEQMDVIRAQCARTGVLPLYAFRRKGVRGDAWRLFTLPGLSFPGAVGALSRSVPAIEKTPRGNDVLAWGNGLPLARFLERVCSNGSARASTSVAVHAAP